MPKLFSILLLLIAQGPVWAVDYFWVGNTGNWSDLTHWSASSGGAGSAFLMLPTTDDNVSFDGNSFSIGGQTVTVDIDGACDDLNFSGVTNNPDFSGVAGRTIDVGGSIIFTLGFTHSYLGEYNFSSTGAETITAAGQTFNNSVEFNGFGGSWVLADAFVIAGEVGLRNGILDFNGVNVSATSIDANRGTNARTIDFGGSAVTITGTGTVLDLQGNTTDLMVTPAGALITFSNVGDVTVEVGDEAKSLPSFTFLSTGDVRVNSGGVEDNTKRISYGNITALGDGVDIRFDNNNDDSNIKTFASITYGNNCRYIFGSGDGSGGFGGTNHSIISGDFIVGDDGEGDIRGRYIEFQGDFDVGTGSDCRFVRDVQFKNDFILDGTGGGNIILDQDAEFEGDMNIGGNAIFRLDQDVNVIGDINIASSANVNFNNNGTAAITTITGIVNLGVGALANFGGGGLGPMTFAAINLDSEAQLEFDNATSATRVNDLTLSRYNIIRFNTSGTTTITGTLTAAGGCNVWLWLKSLQDGVTANVTFSSPQAINFNICQDITCNSGNLTNTDGVDLSNNTGITFPTTTSGMTFFWVGSTTGNTKTGSFTTGVNDDWSNPDNWSLTSGSYSGTNSCIPGAQDDIIFDANSFSSGAGNVDLDLFIQAVNDITWIGIPAGCTLDAGLTTTSRELIIFGDLTLNGNVDNQFESLITFSAISAAMRTITSNTASFFGNVEFDFTGGNWSLADDFDMNGGNRADVNFVRGTVNANNEVWTIEDDWIVSGGTFTASGSTVEFDGPSSQASRQNITANGNAFHNLHVNRGSDGGGAEDLCRTIDAITINNNFHIIVGGLEDFGNQITGSAAGEMDIENGGRLILARSGFSTLFPTNYVNANIDLNENGQTRYNSNLSQTISGEPDYGRLYLTNTNSNPLLVDKTLDGPITVNDQIFIDNFNHLIDDGNQITGGAGAAEELHMDPNSQMTLGSAVSSTTFPTNHTNYDIRETSTIIYNSGLNQLIEPIGGGGNERYSNLIINNASGAGNPIKTLTGDVIVRGDLTINADNTLGADAANDYDITLLGNWTNAGVFSREEGNVNFTGIATQTIASSGTTETFYNCTIQNTSAGGIIIEDDISVSNSLMFSDGIIFEGSGGDEVVIFEVGAIVLGASNASHVDGRVEKTGSIAFDFPVGKNAEYRPISIGIPSIAATGFRAEYFETDPDASFDDASLDPTLDHVSSCEYWVLDRTSGTGDATVKLSWSLATSCGITNISDLRVARWDGAVWRDEGAGATTGNVNSGDIESAADVTTFSPFTLSSISSANPLPIDLVSFNATINKIGYVDLVWKTMSETENDYFTVERSINGIDFETLLTVPGAGNSSSIILYDELDRQPFPGISYYRLSQTDFNGKKTTFSVELVNNKIESISISPNPSVGEVLNYRIPEDYGNYTIEIFDVAGNSVYDMAINTNLYGAINTGLGVGLYLVLFESPNGHVVTKRWVVQ